MLRAAAAAVFILVAAAICWSPALASRPRLNYRPDLPPRILHFPQDRYAVARVYLMDWEIRYSVRMFQNGFRDLGAARGEVRVPRGGAVGLVISMEGVDNLASLSMLAPDDIQYIRANSIPLQSADLESFKHLTGLEELDCKFTDLDDEALPILAAFPRLEVLFLENSNMRGTNFGLLSKMPRLRSLHLDYSQVTDAGIKALSSSRTLLDLSLEGNKVTRACLDDLLALEQIEQLRIPGIGLTDEDLMKLAKLKNLKHLKIGRDAITPAGAAAFRKARPDCQLTSLKFNISPDMLF